MSPLLKLSYRSTVVNPAAGNTVWRIGPNSAAALPPKSWTVPGMESPPSCQMHDPLFPLLFVDESGAAAAVKSGEKFAELSPNVRVEKKG
jgi:hypothetical protein